MDSNFQDMQLISGGSLYHQYQYSMMESKSNLILQSSHNIVYLAYVTLDGSLAAWNRKGGSSSPSTPTAKTDKIITMNYIEIRINYLLVLDLFSLRKEYIRGILLRRIICFS